VELSPLVQPVTMDGGSILVFVSIVLVVNLLIVKLLLEMLMQDLMLMLQNVLFPDKKLH